MYSKSKLFKKQTPLGKRMSSAVNVLQFFSEIKKTAAMKPGGILCPGFLVAKKI
ncbi:MAG: hypothetical protein JSV88_08950 [Candidatus Aminicenantes bacterium]|nr:MAG: hypothetical protein JSV88_08950 [Candidatus Aminicenantes bacterium]